jgi:hypothetical protein
MKYLFILCLLFLNTQLKSQSIQDLFKKANTILNNQKQGLNSEDIANGLKEALKIGAEKGCINLSKPDGFFKNAALKILMPPEAQKIESTIRAIGMNQLADDFILSMNRAAEDASATASPIFIKAIQEMTIADGINILKGTDTAATAYLRNKTQENLKASFNPIIKSSLDKVEATKHWSKIVNAYNSIPFMNNKMNPDLAGYVTEKSMKGIYSEIALQEKEIRKNPAARTNELLKKVFN